MENQINRTIAKLAARMHKRDDVVWNLFFDTGIEYLETLRAGISHYEVFKRQFGGLINCGTLRLTPEQTFTRIQHSPLFWNWWACELWSYATGSYSFSLIPENILFKIFENERRIKKIARHRTRTNIQPAQSAGYAQSEAGVC